MYVYKNLKFETIVTIKHNEDGNVKAFSQNVSEMTLYL